jgi:hypothetical protein
MKSVLPLLFIALTVIVGCNSQTKSTSRPLTNQEKHYCDSLGIDTAVVIKLRTQTDSHLLPFPTDLQNVLNRDIDLDSIKKHTPGFYFNASNSNSDHIVNVLYDDLQKMGYTIFSLDENFGISNKPDIIAVLRSTDKYKILNQIQTDGINWDIDNDSMLSIIKVFDEKYSLQLVGASGDWCEFKINNEPANWLELAKEAYKVCPDIVEQGAGTVERLATEMQRTKRLYFWWD